MTGFEPLILAATTGLTGLITETIKDKGKKLLERSDINVDQLVQQIRIASQKYARKYTKRHGELKVLGMRQPIALESIYTAVKFLDEQDILGFISPEALEGRFWEGGKRRLQAQEKTKRWGTEVSNEHQYLMVLGQPGAGKSTFLRRVGLEALKGKDGKYQHRCVPVFLELKTFATTEINLEQEIINEFQNCGYPHPKESTEYLLQAGKLLVLLDGLDEVPRSQINQVISQIQNFVDRYDQNRYIASCRTAAYRHNFRGFTDVTIADFDDEQIEWFIDHWFRSENDRQSRTAKKCWEILCKPKNAAAKELANTPLLLTFLCLVYDRSQTFPPQRAILYRKALRILLEEWAAEKRILRDEIYQGLNTELEEVLLSEIALEKFAKNRLFFSKREVVDQIRQFLSSNINAPKYLDGEAVLDAIAIQQGILVERAEEVYSFSHLTLQEYLTAQYIVDRRFIKPLVRQVGKKRWREVFLLVAESIRDGADLLLVLMEEQTHFYLNTPRLKDLLTWIHEVTGNSESNCKPAAKRSAALFLALTHARIFGLDHTLSLCHAHACDLDHTLNFAHARSLVRDDNLNFARAGDLHPALIRTLALARTFEDQKILSVSLIDLVATLEALKLKVPVAGQGHPAYKIFIEQISQAWFDALRLNPTMVNLTESEKNSLEDYLYANELIMRCKEAAMRVSPQVWAGIEDRMLTVRE